MTMLRRLRRLVAEMVASSPRHAALALLLMVAVGATEGISVLLLLPLLQLVGIGGLTTLPAVVGWFASAFAAVGVTPTLGSVLVVYVAVVGLRTALMRSQAIVNMTLREEFVLKLRARVYRAISGAEWKFLVTRRPSEFVQLLATEVGQVGSAAFKTVQLAVTATVSLVYLALAVKLSPVIAAFVLISAGLMAWVSRRRLSEARVLGARARAARRELHSMISEHVSSVKTAKSYGAVNRHADIFENLSRDLRDMSLEISAGETGLQGSLEFGWTVLLALIVFGAVKIVGVTAAPLLVVLFICARLMPRMVSMNRQLQGLAFVLPVVDVVSEMERECLDAAEPSSSGSVRLDLRSGVRFDKVTFAYLRRSKSPAVMDLDLEIRSGLTTAIVGSSGAGKSTLADLLIGLLSPTAGRVLVDERVLTASQLSGWRESISYVPQDTFLFHDTVRENLSWAKPDASDEALWQALRLAAADEFVAAMPQGLDTVVGERGVLVSGGERQRLSLARALLRQPRVLVLDEATSSLDSETERRIQRAIEGLHQKMTIVIVTHRLSMISGADVIYVLDQGRIVESGGWDELLASRSGRFRELCRAQGIYERPSAAPFPAMSTS